jgi:hypothetical protein
MKTRDKTKIKDEAAPIPFEREVLRRLHKFFDHFPVSRHPEVKDICRRFFK